MTDQIKILLVEDNPGDAGLINIYLKEAFPGFYVLTTASYLSDGIKHLSVNTFDVIILDLTLPDSTGLNTFTKIYQHSKDTPIIVLTGLEDESLGINAMKLGAQDFLIKGAVKGKELKRSINYSMERYKLLKQLSENAKKLNDKTEDLNREKIKLAEAQKLAHIGSWELNIEKKTINWSDELYRIFGLTPQEYKVTYDFFLEKVHIEDRENTKNKIDEAYDLLQPFDIHYRIIRPDNSIRTIHAKSEILKDWDNNPIRVLGTCQDVTKKVYRDELEKLVLAATQSYNSVIIFNNKREVEWINNGFTKLTGYTFEEIVNSSTDVLRKGNTMGIEEQKNIFNSLLKNKKSITYENENFDKNCNAYWVITTATPIVGSDGEVERVIAIDSDITLRKKMEIELLTANEIAENSLKKGNKALDELMKAQKKLEESMKIKEQFLANMSHEIRTPMNAIVGFTDLILKTELTTEQKQYINAVKISGKNLLVIINDILDFSKIQSGKFVFEDIEFKLSQLISTITELMHPKAAEKNLQLSSKIDDAILDNLIGDPTRLNQILLNLVGNAIKFTKQGEVKIVVDLISDDDEMMELTFSVIDTGIGIPEHKLSSVFEEFTQESNETTRKYGGTGLGLTIVKQLVELQGGNVFVESKVGQGTKLSFTLKFKKDLQQGIKNTTTENDAPLIAVENLNILLVEDNILNQLLAKKVLTDYKWNVEVAENGLIAIEKMNTNNFDIVLMDIQMPEMDGNEATRYIRKEMLFPKCDTPIIAMTAHAIAGEAEKCFNNGMNDYISKPFEAQQLYIKILSLVGNKTQINFNNK
jgi:PAS domain S-box-containing protein